MKQEIKVDKYGRIQLPKALREVLGMEDRIIYSIDTEKGQVVLFCQKRRSISTDINQRLRNPKITTNERHFLEKLKEVHKL